MQGTSYFQLLNPMVMLIFAIGFLLIWKNERRMRAALLFAAAYMSGAIGFVLDFAIRDAVGIYWGHFVSNVWLVAIPALVTCGIAERYGKELPLKSIAFVYFATFALASLFLFVWPNSAARAMIMNGGTGILIALGLPSLWQRRDQPLTKLMFWIMLVSAVQFFARPALVIAYSGPGAEQVSYSNSLYALTLHLTSAVCAISLAATLLFSLGIDVVRKLHRQGQTDALTGLLNRRGLADAFNMAQARSATCSVVVADIDHFKAINDLHGHAVGDDVIRAFAALLKEVTGNSGHVARIGGEEFAVLLTHGDVNSARLLAEGARVSCQGICFGSSGEETCTASFGVAGCRSGMPLNNALEAADVALYRAKKRGRNRVCVAGKSIVDKAAAAA